MTTKILNPIPTIVFSAFAFVAGLQTSLHAAVLEDPTLYTTMDPAGARDITLFDSSNMTSQATLEALDGFSVVRDYATVTGGTNVLSFADSATPDIQISFGGTGNNAASSGSNLTNSGFITSAGSGIRVVSSGENSENTIIGTIDFGDWNGSAFSSGAASVFAAGFTLAQPGRWERIESVLVTFMGADDTTVLNTQTISGTLITDKTSNQGLYFGYQAGSGESIGSAIFTVNVNAAETAVDDPLMGLDDISFTAIPEPSTTALLFSGMSVLMVMMRRRK